MPVDLFLCLFIAGAVLLSLSIMLGYFVWYNIGWLASRFNNLGKHEKALSEDLNQAIVDYDPSGIFLSECGEIDKGLPKDEWLALLSRSLPDGYRVWCHSHYTCILKVDDVDVLEPPRLSESMVTQPGHEYRRCQRVVVQFRNSAAKPITLYNVHSPASQKHPLRAFAREQIMDWFGGLAEERVLIGGDLNMGEHSLHEHLKKYEDIRYLFEDGHKHGDLMLAKGHGGAESVACAISRTSDAHRMCVLSVPLHVPPEQRPRAPKRSAPPCPPESHSAAKPASKASGEASEDAKAKAKAAAGETATPTTAQAAAQGRGAKRAGAESEEASEAAKAKAKTEAGKDATSATEGSAEKSSAAQPASKGAGDEEKKPEAEPVEETPLLDIMFREIGARMDGSQAERELFGHLAAQLWTGSFTSPPRSGAVTNPRCSKMRLERLLQKVLTVRDVYQTRAHNLGEIPDLDLERSLLEEETKVVHNHYMNDVGAWMNAETLEQYKALIAEADMEDKGKGKSAGNTKGKGKGKNAGGKKRKDTETGKGGSAGKHGPRQRAQQLKKQRFNKVLNDDAANKAFFMTLVRHPKLMQVDNLMLLVKELKEVKESREYQEMLAASAKKSDDDKELKRKRDDSRVQLNRGKAEFEKRKPSMLAKRYESGELQDLYEEAERHWSRAKQSGVALLLGPRMGE